MIDGKQIIGFAMEAGGTKVFNSFNPATGEKLNYIFHKATSEEVNKAAEKAAAAFQTYRKKSGVEKAVFLETIASEIMAIGDELIELCCLESALPKARIEGERGRTANQLKL